MKILLISTNQEVTYSPVAPLGLAVISAYLEKSEHEVRILDLAYFDDFRKGITESIYEFKPECIGVSIRNIDNSSYLKYENYMQSNKEIVDVIKETSNVPIVYGGSGFTAMPEVLMDYLDGEYGIIGEGELAFCRLMDSFNKRISLDEVPNLIYKNTEGGKLTRTEKVLIEEIGMIKPTRTQLNKSFLDTGDMGSIETKRGCAFGCTYCNIPWQTQRRVRKKRFDSVISELNQMMLEGYKNVYVVDNIFNYPYEHAYNLCREIAKSNVKIDWSCQIHPRYFDKELAEAMLKAGCKSVDISAISAADDVLVALKKGFMSTELINSIEIAKEAGLEVNTFFIFGGPTENAKSTKKTIDLINKLYDQGVGVGIDFGFRILPETEMAKNNNRNRLSDLLVPEFYINEATAEIANEICSQLPKSCIDKANNLFYSILAQRFETPTARWEYIKRLKTKKVDSNFTRTA